MEVGQDANVSFNFMKLDPKYHQEVIDFTELNP